MQLVKEIANSNRQGTEQAVHAVVLGSVAMQLQRVHIARHADRCDNQRNSVRPSVRPSVTFRCFVQINEDTTVRFSLSSIKIILVSGEIKFIWIFVGDHPKRRRSSEAPPIASENLTNSQP